MSYYSLTICFILSLLGNETKQFVAFNKGEVVQVTTGGYTTLTLPFEVLEAYHIQSYFDNSGGLIPTEITFKENNSYSIEHQEFSLRQKETLVLNGVKHEVIAGRFEILVTLKRIENTSNLKLEGELHYQACTDRQCLFPRDLNFQISL